jgi:hypothetical protein
MTTINEIKEINGETLPRCQGCNTIELHPDNSCDFCFVGWCDHCIPDDISFSKCDTCNIKWCYFNGRRADYRCQRIGKCLYSGSCDDCGL